MKSQLCFVGAVLLAAASAARTKDEASPIQKVLELLTALEGKIISQGGRDKAAYAAYASWCAATSMTKANAIKTAASQKDLLEVTIAKAASDGGDAKVKIAKLIKEISIDESKLKQTAAMRKAERKDFEASVKELTTAIAMMAKASDVLAKQVSPTGASLLDLTAASSQEVEEALLGLGSIIDAIGLANEDTRRLTSLLEAGEEASEAEASNTTQGAAAPPKKSSSIITVLEDMKAKAMSKVDKLRSAEFTSQHNYDALKMALDDKVKTAKATLGNHKKIKADCGKLKAKSKGDLAICVKDLRESQKSLKMVQQGCLQKAADHEISLRGRKDELMALTKAKKMIRASTGAAGKRTYKSLMQEDSKVDETTTSGDDDFLQVASSSKQRASAQSASMRRGAEALELIRSLAKEQESEDLKQLSHRILAVYKLSSLGGDGADPFVKVKSLVKNLIEKLQKEAYGEAKEKAYCDSELKHTRGKKKELKTDVAGLKLQIEKAVTDSTTLKGQVKELQAELAEITDLQGKADAVRKLANTAYILAKKDLDQGMSGMRTALKVLRDYYSSKSALLQTSDSNSDSDAEDSPFSLLQTEDSDSDTDTEDSDSFMEESEAADQPKPPVKHKKSAGAGTGIINVLEVIESDMAKSLAEVTTEEESAQAQYEKSTQENKVLKAAKERDVKWKTQEYGSLDQNVADLKTDLGTQSAELSAVKEYLAKVKDKCIAQPIPYEQRAKRRAAEIKGLESALATLKGQKTSFLQSDN